MRRNRRVYEKHCARDRKRQATPPGKPLSARSAGGASRPPKGMSCGTPPKGFHTTAHKTCDFQISVCISKSRRSQNNSVSAIDSCFSNSIAKYSDFTGFEIKFFEISWFLISNFWKIFKKSQNRIQISKIAIFEILIILISRFWGVATRVSHAVSMQV